MKTSAVLSIQKALSKQWLKDSFSVEKSLGYHFVKVRRVTFSKPRPCLSYSLTRLEDVLEDAQKDQLLEQEVRCIPETDSFEDESKWV